MNHAHAERIADRIADLWPNTKIAHHEWVKAFEPERNGVDPYDFDHMTEALDQLARKQAWPPSIVEVLQAHKDLIPRPPTPPHLDVVDAPGLARPDAPSDTEDRFKLKQEHCAAGLDHVAQIREQMIAQAARARPGGRRRDRSATTPLEAAS